MSNPIIITVALGKWYPKGQSRLIQSLFTHGWTSIKGWVNTYPTEGYNEDNPYTCKAAAFEAILDKGYDVVLWCDSSIYAVKDITPLMELINEKGYFFWGSGENCAQTVSDKCLKYFGISRNKAEKIPECATSVFGVNLKTEIGRKFAVRFIQATHDGAADGSRQHDRQSKDPRFKYHRQDQSVASLIMHELGMELEQTRYVGYKAYLEDYENIDYICLLNEGM
jgi:hypothetical protein